MRWMGLKSEQSATFSALGLGLDDVKDASDDDTLVTQGTLLIEAQILPVDRPVNLLRYGALDPWPVALSVVQEPDGTFRLLLRQGARHVAICVKTDLGAQMETVHISYRWDAPARRGTFAIYAPDRAILWNCEIRAPFPMCLRDLRRITMDDGARRLSPTVSFVALGKGLHPIGPQPGIGPGAQVSTSQGIRPISSVRVGDEVLSQNGEPVKVIWSGAVTLPAAGRFTPQLMRSPYHGLSEDLIVSPDQRVFLSGAEVEYLFGEEHVCAPVRHLSDRRSLVPLSSGNLVQTYYQLLLEHPVAMQVNGAWIGSFEADPLLSLPALARDSVLAGLPGAWWPKEARSPHPVLQGYQTLTLTGACYG